MDIPILRKQFLKAPEGSSVKEEHFSPLTKISVFFRLKIPSPLTDASQRLGAGNFRFPLLLSPEAQEKQLPKNFWLRFFKENGPIFTRLKEVKNSRRQD